MTKRKPPPLEVDALASDEPFRCFLGPAAHSDHVSLALTTETHPIELLLPCGCVLALVAGCS